jgi:hypothetical protein
VKNLAVFLANTPAVTSNNDAATMKNLNFFIITVFKFVKFAYSFEGFQHSPFFAQKS